MALEIDHVQSVALAPDLKDTVPVHAGLLLARNFAADEKVVRRVS
jgi:hypothetical protein